MPFSGSGWTLFHPVALWGLAALAIPVLIHLFNRSRGRLVRIGHIDLIKEARKLKVTELKLAQWLLLLLRMILFALAGLLLAGLARQGLQSSQLDSVYVTPAWLAAAQPQQITDLLQDNSDPASSRLFLLQDNYPVLTEELVGTLRDNQDSQVLARNIWPLLSDRLSIQQHLGNVEVYAVDLLQQFGSERPALAKNVDWHLSHPPAIETSGLLKLKAVIAHDAQHTADADLIRAALVSLKEYRLPGLTWEMVDAANLDTAEMQADWLFILADAGLTDGQFGQLSAPVTVLSDAISGNQEDDMPDNRAIDGAYLRMPYYPFSRFTVSRTGRANDGLQNILSTYDGVPVIQTGQQGMASLVQFNSRFLLGWSSVALQPEFPELVLQLMLSEPQQQQFFADARVLPADLQAFQASDSATPLPRRSQQQILAALMILLWLLERWLSERRRRE